MNNKIYRVRDNHIDLTKLGLSFIDFTGDERLSHRLEMRIQDLTDRKRTGSAVEFSDFNKAQCEFKKLKKGLFHTATDLHLVELTVQMEDSSSEVVVGSTFDYWFDSLSNYALFLFGQSKNPKKRYQELFGVEPQKAWERFFAGAVSFVCNCTRID